MKWVTPLSYPRIRFPTHTADQVFLDVTDMIDYNLELLNPHDLPSSWFHLDRDDPCRGFAYDATATFGHTFSATNNRSDANSNPVPTSSSLSESGDVLECRLRLGSHLAGHLRVQLEEQKGYSSTVGISTNKLISKLVGNLYKPKGQTTLLPPYVSRSEGEGSSVMQFVDAHEIGKIPGIGFKLAQKIREHILSREAVFDAGLVYGRTKEKVTVKEVRLHPGMGPELLESVLGGPGSTKGIGMKIWGLLHGVDDTEVGKARDVPRQISIEDSYIRLDNMEEVRKELILLAKSLIRRMHMDLVEVDEDDDLSGKDDEQVMQADKSNAPRRWLAHPRTLRLTTRPRPPLNLDGSRSRSFKRISRSSPMPTFIFSLTESVDAIAEKLLTDALIPSFRKLHPKPSGWNLSLVNIAATNMSETASDEKHGAGRDIGKMFRRQDDVLKQWRVEDVEPSIEDGSHEPFTPQDRASPRPEFVALDGLLNVSKGSEDTLQATQESSLADDIWDSDHDQLDLGDTCNVCGSIMPSFAMAAHERFHVLPD